MNSYLYMLRNIRLGLLAGILLFAVSACGSSKKATQKKAPQKTSAKKASTTKTSVSTVSKRLGFPIAAKDPNMKLYVEASNWIGVPYKSGGTTKKGADCSGVTQQIYKTVYKKTLHRRSADMATHDVSNVSKGKLAPGDLVFFATSKKNTINHVGIYLKSNYFIHASSKKGVMVSNLNEDYFKKTYKKGGRVK